MENEVVFSVAVDVADENLAGVRPLESHRGGCASAAIDSVEGEGRAVAHAEGRNPVAVPVPGDRLAGLGEDHAQLGPVRGQIVDEVGRARPRLDAGVGDRLGGVRIGGARTRGLRRLPHIDSDLDRVVVG